MYVNVISVHIDAKTEHFAPKVAEYKDFAYDAMSKLEDSIVPKLKGKMYDPNAANGPAPGPPGPGFDGDDDNNSDNSRGGRGGGTVLMDQSM